MENNFAFAADFTNGGDVLNYADFVVHPHYGYQNSVFADGGLEFFQINQAVFLHAEVGHFKALAFQFAHGVEHGFVLGFHGNQVFAFGFVKLRCAFNGEVVGFGSTAGEHDFFGIGIQQFGDFNAGVFYRFFGCPAKGVAVGGGVTELLG